MSSPEPKGEISSGSLVVLETDSAAKSHKTERRRRRTQLSPFKVPDSNSIFLMSVNERGYQKEEMRKFLALPIDEKTTHAARKMDKLKDELVGEMEEEEEEEENEKMKNLKQINSKTVLPKQTSGTDELQMAMRKQDNMTKYNKHDSIFMERQKAVLEHFLMIKRSEILRMDKAVTKEERQLKKLEKIIERDNHNFEAFLRENERKSVEARTHFEREAKSKQKKNIEIKRLTAEIGAIESEIAKFEEILIDYKRYKELLFKLSPPEWQEAQKIKALKTKVLADKDTGDDQSREPEEMAIKNGLENKESSPGGPLPSINESRLISAHSDTLVTNSKPDSDSSDYEDEPELYFSDPQQLLDLMTELTELNLSLIQNSARVEETLEELQQSVETTWKKIEKDEEQITLQINYMKERIDKEKARGIKVEQRVQVHVMLKTEDQDVMLDALSEKVTEVHRSCVDDRMANLSTSEKLANIEKRMSLVLQGLENIPEENLEMMKRIKDSERRSRQREEKLREQREKQKERMRKYLERSLADSKKTSGRRLMPRCLPVTQKVKVSDVDNAPAEDEIHEYLFGSEDME